MRAATGILVALPASLAIYGVLFAGFFVDTLFLYGAGLLALGVALYVFFTGAMRPDPRPGYHPRYERDKERLPL